MPADIPASNWSPTDASNTTASPDGMPEGMAPSGVNDWGRAVMGAVKRWYEWTVPKTTGGTTTAFTLSYTVAPGALVDGMSHLVQFNATSGASPTLNVNSLGAKPIYQFVNGSWTQITTAGTIPSGFIGRVSYNSSEGSYRLTSTAFPIGVALLAVANTFTALLTMSGAAINEAKGADIASATTTDIGAATGNYVKVTGTTTITGLGTIQAGTERTVEFGGALTLTHNGTSLILPGAANITTVAGDTAIFRSLGSGNWKCVAYQKASGSSVVAQSLVGFRANVDGVGAPGALAKMSLASASFNVGGYWNNSTERFTPPAGLYSLQIGLTCAISNSYLEVYLYKNGVAIAFAYQGNSQTWNQNVSISITDQANGTDYYEAYWAGGAISVPPSINAWFSATGIGP